MSDTSFSALLRSLSRDYYHNRIGFEEYRAQRKIILDKVDEEFNGRYQGEAQTDSLNGSSIFKRTLRFFKNTDVE